MKVSMKSWHYRILEATGSLPIAQNLCSYFWNLMFLIVFMPLFVLLCLGLVGLCIYTIITDFVACLVIFSIFASIFVFLALCVWISSDTNIVGHYLKAKKEKICPLVEYVD